MGVDSVGSLLADIAGLIVDGLRILGIADKRHWGQDEHELLRAMERLLDDAKKDFQELSPLVKGQAQYERDRSCKIQPSHIFATIYTRVANYCRKQSTRSRSCELYGPNSTCTSKTSRNGTAQEAQ